MFKYYKDICDVVSLLAYCPSERSYLLNKEPNGEFWIPSSKTEKNCWRMTVQKINFEGVRSRLQWFTSSELERQRAHGNLRSPELVVFAKMAIGDHNKDSDSDVLESGLVLEVCEDNVIVGADVAGGAVAIATTHCQLLQAANYTKEEQVHLYREFVLMVYPSLYMSPNVFIQLMVDIGWQRAQCLRLFRAADVTDRGGLSFLELMLWSAAVEPLTQHNGVSADIRCRYIFRYFDSNRDLKLEFEEFKELTAAARAARQQPVDALSVSRDVDGCLKQLGLQPNSQLPVAEFLRAVGELYFRGTSALLRSPRSIAGYLSDLHERQQEVDMSLQRTSQATQATPMSSATSAQSHRAQVRPRHDSEYCIATYTVRVRKGAQPEMIELKKFDDHGSKIIDRRTEQLACAETAVSASTSKLIMEKNSSILLGPVAEPVETIASIHYFALSGERAAHKQATSATSDLCKSAWAWATVAEEVNFGNMLLRLAEAVRPLCIEEPRVLRLSSPVVIIGDLHGNLSTLLAMEEVLWPSGVSLYPGKLMFLGDYVDRGAHGTELLAYLFAAKLQRPHAVLLIRGNHETRDIQKMFSFYNECITKYGENDGTKIWNAINNVFDALPLAAVVDDTVFCCHGGIPPPWVCPLISSIDKVPVPLPRPAEQSSIAWEIMWNDPVKTNKMTSTLALELAANEGFASNVRRGTGHIFDQSALDRFLIANKLTHVVRAHELYPSGFMCQLKGRLVSVFSSAKYCGSSNDSGVVLLEGDKLRLFRINGD